MDNIFVEIGCHICDALLGGISGDDQTVVDAELESILAEKPLCGMCMNYEG